MCYKASILYACENKEIVSILGRAQVKRLNAFARTLIVLHCTIVSMTPQCKQYRREIIDLSIASRYESYFSIFDCSWTGYYRMEFTRDDIHIFPHRSRNSFFHLFKQILQFFFCFPRATINACEMLINRLSYQFRTKSTWVTKSFNIQEGQDFFIYEVKSKYLKIQVTRLEIVRITTNEHIFVIIKPINYKNTTVTII